MRISSEDVPQADNLDDVLRVVTAVAQGATTDADIAAAIGKVRRQGRYYRRGAEILGFIKNDRNRSILTHKGHEFVQGAAEERERRLVAALLSARMFQRVLPLFESNASNGLSRREIQRFIEQVTQPGRGETLIPRRTSSVISWLVAVGLLQQSDGRYYLASSGLDVPIVHYSDDEPLIPTRHELRAYEELTELTKAASGVIQVLISQAAKERANAAHRRLVNLVARKIRSSGAIPRFNNFIDLSATVASTPYMFEMKSNTSTTFHPQLRRAISQLYEYRYMQQADAARLVIVMEGPPQRSDAWLVDYVVRDRRMLIAWNGDGERLHTPPALAQQLAFLN
jgi:hypothetical protein